MGTRLRRDFGTALLTLVLLIPGTARAEEFSACWVTSRLDPSRLEQVQVTRCRVAGGRIVDYASDSDVPGVLYPNIGTDLVGECWYYTSRTTQYVILALYGDGSAEVGWDPDSGGIIALGPRLPRCSSEPTEASQPVAEAWEYVISYIHPPPILDVNPRSGDGITGLATFVGVAVPADHRARITTTGGTVLELFVEVSTVIVDWGDGTVDTYPATPQALAGYPDGIASHIYETKNPDYMITVSYDWTARWRIIGGPWQPLPVPNTTTSIPYPVAEIISDLTG